MKHVLIIMVACVLILSAFGLTIPKYGLYYEVVVERIFDNVSGLIDAGSYMFQDSNGLLNSLFNITEIPKIELTKDSAFRLLTFDDYYAIQVVDLLSDLNGEKLLSILTSNVPDFYYFTVTSDGKLYKIYDSSDKLIYHVDSSDIVFSDIYLYEDFKTFLTDNSYPFADKVIKEMEEHLNNGYRGGR